MSTWSGIGHVVVLLPAGREIAKRAAERRWAKQKGEA
jgi:hypothetical protein